MIDNLQSGLAWGLSILIHLGIALCADKPNELSPSNNGRQLAVSIAFHKQSNAETTPAVTAHQINYPDVHDLPDIEQTVPVLEKVAIPEKQEMETTEPQTTPVLEKEINKPVDPSSTVAKKIPAPEKNNKPPLAKPMPSEIESRPLPDELLADSKTDLNNDPTLTEKAVTRQDIHAMKSSDNDNVNMAHLGDSQSTEPSVKPANNDTSLHPPKNKSIAIPHYHRIPKPPYPSRSRSLGEEGTVIIAVLVSEKGDVKEATLSRSSGYPLLDDSALKTVKDKWKFIPGTQNGVPVESRVRVPITFKIGNY